MKSFPLFVVLLCGVCCWKLSDGVPVEQRGLLATNDGDVPSLSKSSLTDSQSQNSNLARVKRQSSGGAGTGNGQSGATDTFTVLSMILDIGGKGICLHCIQ